MKRRDFVYGTTAIVGAEILARIEATAQTAPAQALRVSRLVDPALTPAGTACNDVIFDDERFLCLYGPAGDVPPNRQFSVAATSPAGTLLWNYSLPKGTHFRLGTHGDLVISLAARYAPLSGNPVASPIWILDPKTGGAIISGEGDASIPLSYAGDSLFFGVKAGQGQIWNLDGDLKVKASKISAQSFAARMLLQERVSTDTMAIAGVDGNWLARVSISSGAVIENPMSGDFLSNVRTFYESFYGGVLRRNGIDSSKARVAKPSIILAIGGDRNGGIYALVSTPKRGSDGLASLVQFDQHGASVLLGELQLPTSASGRPFFPMKLAVVNSELCIASFKGDAAWYSLPMPA